MLPPKSIKSLKFAFPTKIKKDDITTQYISIYTQYEYPNTKAQIVGQQAQQTLTVSVRGEDKMEEISGLSSINLSKLIASNSID